jgi:hypothetical protein
MMPTIITVAVARLAGGFQLADFTTELRDVIGHFEFRTQIVVVSLVFLYAAPLDATCRALSG